MGKESATEVIRTAVDRVSACCRAHLPEEQVKAFKEKNIIRWESETVDLTEEQCRARLRNLLRAIQFPIETEGLSEFPSRYAIIAFDNIDRMSDISITQQVFQYAMSLTKDTRALVFYPVRHSTKIRIDDQGLDEATNRAKIEVHAPDVGDVLKARIDWTFGEQNPAYSVHSDRVKTHLGRIGGMDVELEDVGQALTEAMIKLTERWEKHRLIPELAGQNTRAAIDIFRQILLSPWISADEFLALRTGALHHPYRLLQYLMRGEYEAYQRRYSTIMNLFDSSDSHGLYFSKIRVLDTIITLQEGEPGDDYVCVQQIRDSAEANYTLSPRVTDSEIWEMLTTTYRLLELQTIDDQLPNDQLGSVMELDGSAAIRVNSCGRLYRKHLLYQLSYVQVVMEDTLMPVEASEAIALPLAARWETRCRAVRQFLDFLAAVEEIESVSYRSEAARESMPVSSEMRVQIEGQIERIEQSREIL